MKKYRNYIVLYICSFILISKPNKAFSKKILKILTKRSFTKCYGKEIKNIFEKKYNCQIKYVIINSLKHLELLSSTTNSYEADLLVCMDHESVSINQIKSNFEDHNLNIKKHNLIDHWIDKKFMPYQKAILSFVYNSKNIKSKIKSFEDIINSNIKLVIMDPRLSCTGLGLLQWVKKLYKNESKKFWKKFSPQILTVTKGWTEGYSLFINGECDMVLSYISSPAYHKIKENKGHIKAAIFDKGHYNIYYVTGILKKSKNKKLAKLYIQELLDTNNQKKMIYTDWVHPIIDLGTWLPSEFIIPKKIHSNFTSKEIKNNKQRWIKEWEDSF